jgi:hypothetical protein
MIPIEREILNEICDLPRIEDIVKNNKRVPLIESILLSYQERTKDIFKGTSADSELRQVIEHFKDANFWKKFDINSGEKIVYLSGHSMGL